MRKPDHIVYMDHASTTPMREEALYAMMPYFSSQYGNPGSPHPFGNRARRAVDDARRTVAQCVGCRPEEVFFTSGGTESDNWAIKGTVILRHGTALNRIAVSNVEHHAVLHSCEAMEKRMGTRTVYLTVDKNGFVNMPEIDLTVDRGTMLVSVMMANNEVGTIQPVQDIARRAHDVGALYHTDATQAVGHMPVDFCGIGCDMMSLSAHKFGGPKGVGALIIRNGVKIARFMDGGHQESGLRASTENVPGIVGMAEALKAACESMEKETAQVRSVAKRLYSGLAKIPDVIMTGHPTVRLPGIVSVIVGGVESEALLIRLEQAGICASSGAACTTGDLEPSHVISAMGLAGMGAPLRLSLAASNTIEEADYVVEMLMKIVPDLRRLA